MTTVNKNYIHEIKNINNNVVLDNDDDADRYNSEDNEDDDDDEDGYSGSGSQDQGLYILYDSDDVFKQVSVSSSDSKSRSGSQQQNSNMNNNDVVFSSDSIVSSIEDDELVKEYFAEQEIREKKMTKTPKKFPFPTGSSTKFDLKSSSGSLPKELKDMDIDFDTDHLFIDEKIEAPNLKEDVEDPREDTKLTASSRHAVHKPKHDVSSQRVLHSSHVEKVGKKGKFHFEFDNNDERRQEDENKTGERGGKKYDEEEEDVVEIESEALLGEKDTFVYLKPLEMASIDDDKISATATAAPKARITTTAALSNAETKISGVATSSATESTTPEAATATMQVLTASLVPTVLGRETTALITTQSAAASTTIPSIQVSAAATSSGIAFTSASATSTSEVDITKNSHHRPSHHHPNHHNPRNHPSLPKKQQHPLRISSSTALNQQQSEEQLLLAEMPKVRKHQRRKQQRKKQQQKQEQRRKKQQQHQRKSQQGWHFDKKMPETITLWNQDESEERLSEYSNINRNNNNHNNNHNKGRLKKQSENNYFGRGFDGRIILNKDAPPPPR